MEKTINFENAVKQLTSKLTPDTLGQIKNVFTFIFKDTNETFIIDGTDENGKGWQKGTPKEHDLLSDFQITISTEDFAKLVFGKLNPMMGMLTGRMKLKGSIGEALKLDKLLKD
jgi:putative sterol carrier protein